MLSILLLDMVLLLELQSLSIWMLIRLVSSINIITGYSPTTDTIISEYMDVDKVSIYYKYYCLIY